MRGNRVRESAQSEVNMTPMLDVVFIMLIFFIVTASFVKEAGVDVIRPPAQTAEAEGAGQHPDRDHRDRADLGGPPSGRTRARCARASSACVERIRKARS